MYGGTPLNWDDFSHKNLFVMDMCCDLNGRIWVGTEEKGVFCYDPTAEKGSRRQHFMNQLADPNGYAVSCDRLGRVWVGHLRNGVSVFNGKKWKNYGLLDGPLGVRVFDITCNPINGDVWIATSAGLTCYHLKEKNWTHYTRANGLPEDQVSAIAFDKKGMLYIGTQCHGIVKCCIKPRFKVVSHTTAPIRFGSRKISTVPLRPVGKGLPTNLINDIIVTERGTVYAATCAGLAWSNDHGKKWRYIRGKDYASKVRGLLGGTPNGWKAASKVIESKLLPEDYITTLVEDANGDLLLGFRTKGFGAISGSKHIFKKAKGENDWSGEFVNALLAADGKIFFGGYGKGIDVKDYPWKKDRKGLRVTTHRERAGFAARKSGDSPLVNFPVASMPPSVHQIGELVKKVHRRTKTFPKSSAVYLGEDWQTQGDWVGRYGRERAILCGTQSPFDDDLSDPELCEIFKISSGHVSGSKSKELARLGPHHRKGDSLRYWIHWLKTGDSRTLYNPFIGYRRQASWDDHGETYPRAHDGPDMWFKLKLPEGLHRLSLYFFNKDGHHGNNRQRDYLVEIKSNNRHLYRARPLAMTRVRHFRGGVYKSFLLAGKSTYWVHMRKNYSFNTIVSGVFIDSLTKRPVREIPEGVLSCMGDVSYKAPDWRDTMVEKESLKQVRKLWLYLDEARRNLNRIPGEKYYRLLAYRVARKEGAPERLLSAWRWKLRIWNPQDIAEFARKMKSGWEWMCINNPKLNE